MTTKLKNAQAKIIGIDGLGGSGKTTYAKKLQQRTENSILFHLDDFIHPKNIRYDSSVAEWEAYYTIQWRYDYLIENIIDPIKNGFSINKVIEFYNKELDEYIQKHITISAETTVIIEGVFLQRSELRKYFDTVIYIDVEKETRLKRVLERDHYMGSKDDILNKYERRYFPAEEKYVLDYNPVGLADRVITDLTILN